MQNKFIKSSMILACFFAIMCRPVFAAEYYVSPNGASGSGSISDPWSLAYANTKLKAGDIAKLRGGKYVDQVIKPSNSGVAGKPITYVAYPGEKPEFRGSKPEAVDYLIVLKDRSYIIVDGISADGEGIAKDARINRWAIFDNTTYSIIQNSTLKRSRGYVALDFIDKGNSHHNKILNNVVDTNGTWDIFKWDGVHDDRGSSFWIKAGNHHNLIEGNTFRRSGHDTGGVEGEYNIIRRNVFDNDWGVYEGPSFTHKEGSISAGDRVGNRTLSIKAGNNNLIEENIIKNVPESVDDENVPMIKFMGTNQILRNNYFMNANHGAIAGGIGRANRNNERNVAYHNTFYNLGGPVYRISIHNNDYGVPEKNTLKNNIFYKTHLKPNGEKYDAAIMYKGLVKYFGDPFLNNKVAYNCIASNDTAATSAQKINTDVTYITTLSDIENKYGEYFYGNLQVNPNFKSLDEKNPDYLQLTSASKCKGAGDDLTKTKDSGSGTRLFVDDSTYFVDGYGLIKGDLIRVGNNSPVRITSINYNKHEITVNSSITWNKGDGVNLSFYGSQKPDMGSLVNLNEVYDINIQSEEVLIPPVNVVLIPRQ